MGLSRQEVIRRAVLACYELAGYQARVGDAAERGIVRWADVIDRLGTV